MFSEITGFPWGEYWYIGIAFIIVALLIFMLTHSIQFERPIRTKRYYTLPLLTIKGKVHKRYHLWGWAFHSMEYYGISFKTEDGDIIVANIPPFPMSIFIEIIGKFAFNPFAIEKHAELDSLEVGDIVMLSYRKGKLSNYFENFERLKPKIEETKS